MDHVCHYPTSLLHCSKQGLITIFYLRGHQARENTTGGSRATPLALRTQPVVCLCLGNESHLAVGMDEGSCLSLLGSDLGQGNYASL